MYLRPLVSQMEKKASCVTNVSMREELSEYANNHQKIFSVCSKFTAKDMKLLQSDSIDTPEYKFALQKYSLYLYALVEDFERGPHGSKSNLDKDGRLKVLNENDSDRMLLLARDYTRDLFHKSDSDEFHILYERYADALCKMAVKAQERGLVCWSLQSKEQSQVEQHRALDGLRLRQRGPV